MGPFERNMVFQDSAQEKSRGLSGGHEGLIFELPRLEVLQAFGGVLQAFKLLWAPWLPAVEPFSAIRRYERRLRNRQKFLQTWLMRQPGQTYAFPRSNKMRMGHHS